MPETNNWKFELEQYIRQSEPTKTEKSKAWETAIGLQDVDGLKTSEYLLETAKEHIEGKIDIDVAQKRIQSYYEERADREDVSFDTMEADIVASRIAALLGEQTFQFSPAEWQTIHKRLFEGVFNHAGIIRTYNITKKEWVLKGATVLYASAESIKPTLAYDFDMEKQFSYEGLSVAESIKHISKFTSGIWQIHPFCEGNTRATAVFIIKYLKTFGFRIGNDVFANHSWYFRNALVRANYNNFSAGINATTEYLELFFENLLLNKNHELKNRYLHIEYAKEIRNDIVQSANQNISKCQNGTLNDTINCTLDELAILQIVADEPTITQRELARKSGKSERTIKRKTVELQEKGYLRRLNGKRNGRWEILIKLPLK
ncbi:MAG: winged helix-turn-helix transcriptional regulator [Lachnospiraceae bacterium]|nr:winged helix-turn-helix transcriptional regulator [Lachnospiraceae bacterium]